MAVLYTNHFVQFFDDSGNPLSNGKLYAYSAGTTTPKATYTTEEATVEHANPIVLDSSGRATIFIQGSYRFDLFDQNDVLIKSTDDVASFTALNESAEPFFQSFSGDGSQTVFTLSESLGNDSKDIMVYVDNGRPNYIDNGDFAADTDWTKGAGWTIGSGVATASTASTALSQDANATIVEGQSYVVVYTVTRSAGTVTPSVGGVSGTAQNASGTYREVIIAGSTQEIAFTGAGFTGTVDDVTVKSTADKGYEILNPSSYTLSGTALTIAVAPEDGTDNIYVFAPTKLLGAAAASAAAAAASEAAAAASATEAAANAGLLDITSTSSVLIGEGAKTFTVSSGLSLAAGQWVIISSDAAPTTDYMTGNITSYSSTTLIVNVTQAFGSGTLNDWTIKLSGVEGEQGPAGSVGTLLSDNNTWTGNNTFDNPVTVDTPTATGHATTKDYVDTAIAGVGSDVTSVDGDGGVTVDTTTGDVTVSLDTNNSLGVGSTILAKNGGAGVANGGTTAGSNLSIIRFDSSNVFSVSGVNPSGTWRNVNGNTLATNESGFWIRTV